MDVNFITKLINENSEIINFGEFGKGVSDEWIAKAESRLNVKFPPSYIWWLKNYSGGEIKGEEIFSIYEIDFDSVVGGDIVYMNELNRKNGISDENKLDILENDFGETYYFNLQERDVSGECPIYIDITGKKYADNFFDFIKKRIID